MHTSLCTIDSPEFINLQPLEISPLMSSCEIKVLYLGENRNHSYISKEVATEMAKTLRGAPIVGYYKEDKEDFADHGQRCIMDDEGIKFDCMTVPYGFVSPDAKVWFQTFEEYDDFGNSVIREYLMTTGYLWTEQFKECKVAVEEGRNQSMELDEDTLDGHWSTNSKTGIDFFIINDATFSKLCILGDDVEPCFEGARVTAPEVSTSFTKMDDSFKNTLYTMMKELKFALEGGQKMDIEETVEEVVETTEEILENEDKVVEPIAEENEESIEEEVQSNEEETIVEESTEEVVVEEEVPATTEEIVETVVEEEIPQAVESTSEEYSLLEAKYNELELNYSNLKAEYDALVEFKNQIENEKKDALINDFYMLSDEDKADVIANKANYSLEEIEAKLSVICVRKKVSFDLEETSDEEENRKDVMTYSLNNKEEIETVPEWISAVIKYKQEN